jgi:hypothetical protein
MAHEIELGELDLRYEDYRLKQASVEARLLTSIAQRGIEEPLEGVEGSPAKVLLNGFKRYRCACRLRLPTVPFVSLGLDEVTGILGLLRTAKNKSLSILEQARFIDELRNVRQMNVAQIAAELSVSKAWVSMRLGLLGEMSPLVRQKLFSGAFPVYPYMYTLRQFRRMNGVKKEEIEQFVVAVSGKDLSVRDIEQLAHGFFRGPASFRQEILQGNVALPLRQMRQVPDDPEGCSAFERVLLGDLEVLLKYMQRVMGKSQDPRLESRMFHAQAHLLTGGILSRGTAFLHSLKQLHDRTGQAQSHLPPPPGRHEPTGDCPAAEPQPWHRANGDRAAGPGGPHPPQGQADDRSGSAPAALPGV